LIKLPIWGQNIYPNFPTAIEHPNPVDLNLDGYSFIMITYITNIKLFGIEFTNKHNKNYSYYYLSPYVKNIDIID
jgi:hypothetical protein